MRIHQNSKFLATRALRLFLSAAILPMGFGSLTETVWAADIQVKEEHLPVANKLVSGLQHISKKFNTEIPQFALRDVEFSSKEQTKGDEQSVPKGLKEGQKNLAYFQHALEISLGKDDGQKKVNEILNAINTLIPPSGSYYYYLYTPPSYASTKTTNEIFKEEQDRLRQLMARCSKKQENAANEIIAIIMNSCPSKVAINNADSASEVDAAAILTMMQAHALHQGQHAYGTAFSFFLNLSKETLTQLQEEQSRAMEAATAESANKKREALSAYEAAKAVKDKAIEENKAEVGIESENHSPVAQLNLAALIKKRGQLDTELANLTKDHEAFVVAEEKRLTDLSESHKKILLEKLAELAKAEGEFYGHFGIAFNPLGATGFKMWQYGVRGTRETHTVWNDLDIIVAKLQKQGLELSNQFNKQFIDALDRFKFLKTVKSEEATQEGATTEFTSRDVLALKGVELATMKEAILKMFGIEESFAKEVRIAREIEERKALEKQVEEAQILKQNLVQIETPLQEPEGLTETGEQELAAKLAAETQQALALAQKKSPVINSEAAAGQEKAPDKGSSELTSPSTLPVVEQPVGTGQVILTTTEGSSGDQKKNQLDSNVPETQGEDVPLLDDAKVVTPLDGDSLRPASSPTQTGDSELSEANRDTGIVLSNSTDGIHGDTSKRHAEEVKQPLADAEAVISSEGDSRTPVSSPIHATDGVKGDASEDTGEEVKQPVADTQAVTPVNGGSLRPASSTTQNISELDDATRNEGVVLPTSAAGKDRGAGTTRRRSNKVTQASGNGEQVGQATQKKNPPRRTGRRGQQQTVFIVGSTTNHTK